MSINTTSRFALSWQCHVKDEGAMLRFIKEARYTGKTFYVTEKSPYSENTAVHSCLRVSACQKWAKDLERNFNIVSNKTHRLRPPNLHSDFLKCCYIVGLFDGDGAVSHARLDMAHIAYGSASKDIVQWVYEFIESRFPFKMKKKTTKVKEMLDGRYYHYSLYGMSAVKFFDFVRRLDIPRFARKWDNPAFLALVETYRQKWPEFFSPDKELAFDPAGNIVFASTLAAGQQISSELPPKSV